MLYNYLDWLVPWALDDYVTLDDKQEALVDRSLAQMLSWHRQQQLPLYVKDLQIIRQQASDKLSVVEVIETIGKIRAHWQTLVSTLFPALVELGQSLTDKQVEQLVTSLREELDEQVEEHEALSDKEQHAEWAERVEEELTGWLGELNTQQRDRIVTWSEQRTSTFELWVAFRYRWIDALQQTLAIRNDPQLFNQGAEQLLLNVDELREEKYLAQIEQNRLVYAELLVDISAAMTKQQHQHLDKRLAELIADLTALHQEG
jgi:hypothetical protein